MKDLPALILLFTAASAWARGGQDQSSPERGEVNLALKDLTRQRQTLAAYRGKIVVLNFWATWCEPCRDEMPLLASAYKRYADQGVVVIGASADDESTQGQIPNFIQKLKIDFPVWTGATTEDMQQLGLGIALPATAFIDRDGQMAARILGPIEKSDLRKRIEYLLGSRTGPAPPPLVDNITPALKKRQGKREGEEHHTHGGVGMEGASTVPS